MLFIFISMFYVLHFSELKRRLKAEKKAKEKAEKEQQNENSKANAKPVTKSAKEEEEISPNVFLILFYCHYFPFLILNPVPLFRNFTDFVQTP